MKNSPDSIQIFFATIYVKKLSLEEYFAGEF